MRIFLVLILLTAGAPAWAQNKQPISKSLAECSVIFKVMGITAGQKAKPQEQLDKFQKGSDVFLETAYKEASQEGQPENYIDGELPGLNEKWDKRWISGSDLEILGYMPENIEWTKYCAALGKDRGILPIQ